jgi:hypothetical protein
MNYCGIQVSVGLYLGDCYRIYGGCFYVRLNEFLSSQLVELGGSTCGWLKVIWFRMDYGLAEGSLRYKVTKKQMGLLNKAWCYRWSKWIYNRTGLHSKSISWDISWLPAMIYRYIMIYARYAMLGERRVISKNLNLDQSAESSELWVWIQKRP